MENIKIEALEKKVISKEIFNQIKKSFVIMINSIINEYKKVIEKPLGYTTVREYIKDLKKFREIISSLEFNKSHHCDFGNMRNVIYELTRSLDCNNEYVLVDGKRIDSRNRYLKPKLRLMALLIYKELLYPRNNLLVLRIDAMVGDHILKIGNEILNNEINNLAEIEKLSDFLNKYSKRKSELVEEMSLESYGVQRASDN